MKKMSENGEAFSKIFRIDLVRVKQYLCSLVLAKISVRISRNMTKQIFWSRKKEKIHIKSLNTFLLTKVSNVTFIMN